MILSIPPSLLCLLATLSFFCLFCFHVFSILLFPIAYCCKCYTWHNENMFNFNTKKKIPMRKVHTLIWCWPTSWTSSKHLLSCNKHLLSCNYMCCFWCLSVSRSAQKYMFVKEISQTRYVIFLMIRNASYVILVDSQKWVCQNAECGWNVHFKLSKTHQAIYEGPLTCINLQS